MCSTNVDRSERLPWLWLAALAGMQLLLDLALAPRVMGEGDAAEFTLVLAVAGVPHPPGYPLYTLFGHAFVCALHALGVGWPFAASLWSVAGAAAATLLTAALADHMIPVGTRLALPARLAVVAAALLAIAANPVFLRAATQAEVYSWQTAWVAGSALAALTLWRMLARASSRRAHSTARPSRLGGGPSRARGSRTTSPRSSSRCHSGCCWHWLRFGPVAFPCASFSRSWWDSC